MDSGWCPFPAAILAHAADIGLEPTEGWLVIHLLCFKWTDNDHSPPLAALARRTGMCRESLQQALSSLQSKGLLRVADKCTIDGQKVGLELDLSPMFRLINDRIMRGVQAGSKQAGGTRDPASPGPSLRKRRLLRVRRRRSCSC